MTHIYTPIALLIAFAVSGASIANAACDTEHALSNQLKVRPEMRVGALSQVRRDLRQLRNAARVLNTYGRQDACQTIVNVVLEIAKDPVVAQQIRKTGSKKTKAVGKQPERRGGVQAGRSVRDQNKSSNGDPTPQRPAATPVRPVDSDTLKRFSSAKSISNFGGMIRIGRIIGSDLFGPRGEEIGEITDVILDENGKPAYALISFGGLLGFGGDLVALPFDLLKVSIDRAAFFVPMSAAELNETPKYKEGGFDLFDDHRWRQRMNKHFEDRKKK